METSIPKAVLSGRTVAILAALTCILIGTGTKLDPLRLKFGRNSGRDASILELPFSVWTGADNSDELANINPSNGSLCEIPTDFPSDIQLSKQLYENWAGTINSDESLTAAARSPDDVVRIANWAVTSGYTLRPRGNKHGWSPISLPQNQHQIQCAKVILIDTTKYLTKMKMISTITPAAVQVEAGTSLENLLVFLEENGFGIGSHPATGDISIGGILAVSGHGSGEMHGSFGNLVISLNAVVWNELAHHFEIRTFHRSQPETKAFITNLGRIFITEVTLRVTPAFHLQSISRGDIPATELFANPDSVLSTTRTFGKFLDTAANVEMLWFPFTPNPWLKVFINALKKPASSTHVVKPYNYPLTDNFPRQFIDFITDKMITVWKNWTPLFTWVSYQVASVSSSDLWGYSKNALLYVKSSTFRVHELGYNIITNRKNVQLVLSQFTTFYENLVLEYAEQGLYPANTPLHARVTGLDDPGITGVVNAEAPALSTLKPVSGRPDLDRAIWVSVLSFPGTENQTNFMQRIETFLRTNYHPSLAIVRPEWAKGWAYTETSAWENRDILQSIPGLYRDEFSDDWNFAMSIYKKHDPLHIFTNSFLDKLFKHEVPSACSHISNKSNTVRSNNYGRVCNRIN